MSFGIYISFLSFTRRIERDYIDKAFIGAHAAVSIYQRVFLLGFSELSVYTGLYSAEYGNGSTEYSD